MLLAALSLAITQQIPARVVIMEATLGGKPYGTVTYVRGLVPGKGLERTVTMVVKEEGTSYTIEEKRSYSSDGTPTTVVRKVTEGDKHITVTLTYHGKKAVVIVSENGEAESEEVILDNEKATIQDPTQLWFQGVTPKKGLKTTFWEFSLDDNAWVEREVSYEGTADVKVGEKTVKGAHRIAIGKQVSVYVDEFGMPYRTIQDTAAGTLNLIRTSPPIEERP